MNRSHVKLFAAVAAMLAMAFRGLLPAGWMPDPAPTGSGSLLVICTLHGPARLAADPAEGRHQTPSKQHKSSLCPFATIAHLSRATVAPPMAAPSRVATVKPRPPRFVAFVGRPNGIAHSARAPPATA
jgi:hypothetical protein